MMHLLLWLSACFCVGFPFEIYLKKDYGNIFSTELFGWIYYIEFTPNSGSNQTILWSRDAPQANFDDRRRTEGNNFIIYNLTQRDSGLYVMKDDRNQPKSNRRVEVVAKRKNLNLQYFDGISLTSELDPSICNIYFLPESGPQVEIVRHGQLQDSNESKCKGFKLLEPCGLEKTFYGSCVGQFQVRDNNNDTALVMFVEQKPLLPKSAIWSLAALGCTIMSCLLSVCCCKMKKKREQVDDEEEPAANDKMDPESVALQSNQVSVPSN
ncbi:PREDICTED: uncharacterized protein LOC107098633 isoform X1 [Cyprinodon variegatus]|uniref:uncharacterized protein LOC107098633 isoform X1 n=1 Tax=Cyprinodon variegatus TaxID=28743 RepID=UPI000742A74B|nr:PREDICTED: uncharacterized protein LOC107098633 isoform X1 [Cyprinodon variegatus]